VVQWREGRVEGIAVQEGNDMKPKVVGMKTGEKGNCPLIGSLVDRISSSYPCRTIKESSEQRPGAAPEVKMTGQGGVMSQPSQVGETERRRGETET